MLLAGRLNSTVRQCGVIFQLSQLPGQPPNLVISDDVAAAVQSDSFALQHRRGQMEDAQIHVIFVVLLQGGSVSVVNAETREAAGRIFIVSTSLYYPAALARVALFPDAFSKPTYPPNALLWQR